MSTVALNRIMGSHALCKRYTGITAGISYVRTSRTGKTPLAQGKLAALPQLQVRGQTFFVVHFKYSEAFFGAALTYS